MCVCACVCMCVFEYVCVYAYVHACMCVCVHVQPGVEVIVVHHKHIYISVVSSKKNLFGGACMYVVCSPHVMLFSSLFLTKAKINQTRYDMKYNINVSVADCILNPSATL